ncbi:MAG: branched-chain amino acid aminotransferase [Bacteroidetes bacterium]|nr:MAG: branched-chain amino acid aminotransferase [Bacteroidota bacterium]
MINTPITINRASVSKIEATDLRNPEFGKVTTDHMFLAEYAGGAWKNARIQPLADLSLSPLTLALHYGQSVFEGMKAFRSQDGGIHIFRADKHYKRLLASLKRMAMPALPEEIFMGGLENLVSIDRAWVPKSGEGSMYLRPLLFASEARVGIKVAEQFCFLIVALPVRSYYNRPIRLKVEERFIRAAKGGTGSAKCSGNYGAAFYPTYLAQQEGYDQVIWTDGTEKKNIEESGVMNVFFIIDGKLVTPPLSETILDGVTRDSLLVLARSMGVEVEERPVSVFELEEALKTGRVSEAFGSGTAAVVAPISLIAFRGNDYTLPEYNDQSTMMQLKSKLESIRAGSAADTYNWLHRVTN